MWSKTTSRTEPPRSRSHLRTKLRELAGSSAPDSETKSWNLNAVVMKFAGKHLPKIDKCLSGGAEAKLFREPNRWFEEYITGYRRYRPRSPRRGGIGCTCAGCHSGQWHPKRGGKVDRLQQGVGARPRSAHKQRSLVLDPAISARRFRCSRPAAREPRRSRSAVLSENSIRPGLAL